MPRERYSNYEALRLFGMVIIVSQHYAGYPSWDFKRDSETYLWFNEYFINCMGTTGKIGVDIFLLMTGYFLNGKGLKTTTVARTWIQTVIWSYICLLGACAFVSIDSYWLNKSLMPVTSHLYWFVSSYIMAGLCTGWVAAIAKGTTPSQYLMGLLSLFSLMAVMHWPLEISYSNSQWFIFVIAVGAFIRRFSSEFAAIRTRTLVFILVVASIVNFGSVYAFTFHNIKWANDRHGGNALTRENWSILPLVYAVVLILLTQRWRFSSEVVNKLAGLTLGVYLIHENHFVSSRLWSQWIQAYNHRDSVFLPVITFAQVAFVYGVCSVLEYNRQLLLGGTEEKLANWIGAKIDSVAERVNSIVVDEKAALV